MELRDYFGIIARRFWLIMAGGILAAAAGFGAYWLIGFSYTSTATISIGEDISVGPLDPTLSRLGEDLVSTYQDLATRNTVLDATIAELNLDMSSDELQPMVSATVVEGTQWLDITVTTNNPAMSAAIANSLGRQLIAVTSPRMRNFVNFVEEASPATAANPPAWLVAALGGTLGILIVAGVVFVIEFVRDPIYSAEDVAERINVPVLAVVHRRWQGLRGRRNRTPSWDRVNENIWWPMAQLLNRRLSEKNGATLSSAQQRSILITNADGGHEKAVVAIKLAMAWARSSTRVVLVDADVASPVLDTWLGVPSGPGLTDLLEQEVMPIDLSEALHATSVPCLSVMPAGSGMGAQDGVFYPDRLNRLLEALTDHADLVVVNGAPVLTSTESAMIASQVAGVVLTVRNGETRVASVIDARFTLTLIDSDLWGIVLTKKVA